MFAITAFLSCGCVTQDIGSAHLDDVTLLITDSDYLIQLHLAHKADALGPVTCGWPEVLTFMAGVKSLHMVQQLQVIQLRVRLGLKSRVMVSI